MDPNAEDLRKVNISLKEEGDTLIVNIESNPDGRGDYDKVEVYLDGKRL